MLFGDDVTLENLNGTSIARALDVLYSVDLSDLS